MATAKTRMPPPLAHALHKVKARLRGLGLRPHEYVVFVAWMQHLDSANVSDLAEMGVTALNSSYHHASLELIEQWRNAEHSTSPAE